jgi:uncharacterized protein YkwD
MARFRNSAALVVLVTAVAAGSASAATIGRSSVRTLGSFDAAVVAQVNAVRAQHGLRRLTLAPGLAASARIHSREMAVSGVFEHDSPGGMQWWKRIRLWYGPVGYSSWSVGETLAWRAPSPSAAQIVTMWLNSPEHRAILLGTTWRELGVSAVQSTAAPGDFDNLDATIVTADFGVRSGWVGVRRGGAAGSGLARVRDRRPLSRRPPAPAAPERPLRSA